MQEESNISRALRELGEQQNLRVGIRKGKLCIIYKQDLVGPVRDGIITTKCVLSDITDEQDMK